MSGAPAWGQAQLVFTSAPQVTPLGLSSQALTVQVVENGNPKPVAANTAVSLSTGSAWGQFNTTPDSTSGAWASTLTVTIAAGQSASPAFYYRDGSPGTPTLTATSAGLTSGAQAQSVLTSGFADDFESGTLLTSSSPAGQWPYTVGNAAFVSASPAAVHRGAYGFRLTDTNGAAAASGFESALGNQFAPVPNAIFVRTWVRLTSGSSPSDSIFTVTLTDPNTNNNDLGEFDISFPSAAFTETGFDSTNYFIDSTALTASSGIWHLVEMGLSGLGTTSGERRVWVDGALVADRTGLSWTTASGCSTIHTATLGEFWANDHTFTGVLDFDDYRIEATPPASHLDLGTLNGGAPLTGCTRVDVALRDSASSALAPAPYAFGAALAVQGVTGAFYADPACSQPVTSASFAAGAQQSTVYLWASSKGAGSVSASYVDFLPALAGVTSQTSGPPPSVQPLALAVGCSCTAAAGGQALGAVLGFCLGLLLTRRRPPPPPGAPEQADGGPAA